MRAAGLILGSLLVLGCGGGSPCPHDPDLPASWTLAAPGITVEVQRRPYGYTVRDAAGAVVLSTLGVGAGDGYGSLAWARGRVAWNTIVSPGYFSMDAFLDPWRDAFEVVAARKTGDGELEVTLEAAGERSCTRVTHTLRASTLRVTASVEDDAPRVFGAAFATTADEGFLGFGERYNRTNQRGLDLYCFPEEGGLAEGEDTPAGPDNPFPNGETMTYYPVPFFLSTRGYGFWLDSTWRNHFNLATDRADAWRVWHIGPSLAYEVYVPLPNDERPWPQHLVDLFTQATGRPMVPPPWTLGPRRRINRGDVQQGVPEIQAMRDLDLAITALDDANHFLPAGSDLGHETEIAAFVAEAQRLGYRVCGYYNPYLADDPESPLSDTFQDGVSQGYFFRDGDGNLSEVFLISGRMVTVATVDLTSDAAKAWYQAMFQRALDLGYSGWMYDFGEYVQPEVVAASGMTGEELHNLFPVIYQRAAFEALEAGPHAGDWLTFVRSGYTGASQYSPLVWSGDPDASFGDAGGLPAVVRAGINIGISGVPNWGSDIGGFKCLADGTAAADGELLARWIEFGAMSPNMQDQDACVGGGEKASIFTSDDAQAAWRTYARLHTRLFPYFYTLAHAAHATGAPIIRHLFLEHPDRVDLASVDDAFYCGPALLAAPVVARGARSRDLDLPAGLYLDWRDQRLVPGGGVVTLDAPLDKLPLLLRDGYLVPLLDPAIDTLDEGDHPGVVGPADVADVYDVVGLLSTATGTAAFTLWDGGTLRAAWQGGFVAPAGLVEAASEDELATCVGCFRREALDTGLWRVRVSAAGDVEAGGLTLTADVARRVRWDLYLVE